MYAVLLNAQRRQRNERVNCNNVPAHRSPTLPQARTEVDHAWECMQREMQRLLVELLGTSASATSSAGAASCREKLNTNSRKTERNMCDLFTSALAAGGASGHLRLRHLFCRCDST